MNRRTRAGRHCLAPRQREDVAGVPGLTEVLSAIDLVKRSDASRTVLSIPHSTRDSELLALSQEAADERGVRMEVESQGGNLVLVFAQSGQKPQ